MRVAVTGGTGFVGGAMVAELLADGHEVRVLARKERGGAAAGARPTFFAGDVATGSGLDPLLAGADALVHLVGIIRETGRQTFDAVHRGGTVNALAAASRNGVRRVLHMSALGTRAGAPSRYHASKWAAEEAVRASDRAWTIFRPSIVYGRDDAFVNMLAGLIRALPVIPVFGGGRNRMQPVAVGDVSRAFAFALEDGRSEGKTYELGGRDTLTYREMLELIARILGKRRLFLPVHMGPVKTLVGLLAPLGLPLPVTRDHLLMLEEDNIRRGGEPLDRLGLSLGSFEEGIRTYLRPL
jgi:uncharacterized protein YbjT (DUF2867 family)